MLGGGKWLVLLILLFFSSMLYEVLSRKCRVQIQIYPQNNAPVGIFQNGSYLKYLSST